MDIKLTEEQQKIVDASMQSNLMIKAVAGSGKTSILLKIIDKFLENSGNPEKSLKNILVLTFSESAATEFKRRLRILLKEKYGIVDELSNVTTIHSFTLKIISDHPFDYGFNLELNVEDEIMIKRLRKEAWINAKNKFLQEFEKHLSKFYDKEIFLSSIYDNDFSMEDVLFALYTYQKRYGYTEDKMYRFISDLSLDDEGKRFLFDLYKEYVKILDKLKIEKGIINYDDILYFAYEILKKYGTKNYDLVIVDESQDTSYIQVEIIKLIAGKSRLIIAGDYMQSIYEWRDTEPDYIEELIKEFNMENFAMSTNFRSNENIINIVNSLFESMKSDFEEIESNFHRLEYSGLNNVGNFIIKIFPEQKNSKQNRFEEANFIASKIKELNDSGIPYKDIAILFRSKTHIKEYIEVLKKWNIKYNVIFEKSIFDEIEIKILMDLIYLMEDYKNNLEEIREKLEFKEILYVLFGCTAKDECDEYEKKVLEFIRKKVNIADKIYKSDIINSFLKEFGILKKIESMNNSLERILNIRRFLSIVTKIEESRIMKLEEFIYILNEYSKEKYEVVSLNGINQEGVKLMTIHQSKGLEFSVVILADTEFKSRNRNNFYFHRVHGIKFPNRNILKEEVLMKLEEINKHREMIENLRVLYVALTRAKHVLIIPLHGQIEKRQNPKNFKSFNEIILNYLDKTFVKEDEKIEFKMQRENEIKIENKNGSKMKIGPDIEIKEERIYLSVEELARFIECPYKMIYYQYKRSSSFDESVIDGSIFHERIKHLPVDKIMELIFGSESKIFEEKIQIILDNCRNPKYEYPISLYYKGLIINGRIDLLCENLVIEFKTGKEKNEDINQIKVYLYMLSKIFKTKDLKGVLIYKENKKIIMVNMYDEIEKYLDMFINNDFYFDSYKCNSCDLKDICPFPKNKI